MLLDGLTEEVWNDDTAAADTRAVLLKDVDEDDDDEDDMMDIISLLERCAARTQTRSDSNGK